MRNGLIMLAIALSSLLSCSPEGGEGGMLVMTSLTPYAEMAEAVGGDEVQVIQLLSAGADPHTWEPKPSDMRKASQAVLFIYNGGGLEPGVDAIISALPPQALVIVAASSASDHLEDREEVEGDEDHEEGLEDDHGHDHGHDDDPHIWLDFQADMDIVDDIAAALIEIDSENEAQYLERSAAYKKELARVDLLYQETLEECKQKEFVVAGHSAFSLLAGAYGLQEITISGISPDAESSQQRIIKILEQIRSRGIEYVFYESQGSRRTADTIAEEAGVEVLGLNTGAALAWRGEGTPFLDVLEDNLESLSIGLSCEQPTSPTSTSSSPSLITSSS